MKEDDEKKAIRDCSNISFHSVWVSVERSATGITYEKSFASFAFLCSRHRFSFLLLLFSRSTVYFLIFLLKHEINSKEMNCMNRRLKILEREWMESFY